MKWFKHMSDMADDVKIKRLVRKHGIAGYGLYCYILERIVRRLDSDSPTPDLEESSSDIAADLGMDTVKVEEVMHFCVGQGLFDQDAVSGRIIASKIYKYLQQAQTKSGAIRTLIAEYSDAGSQTVTDGHRPSETNVKTRLDKTRQEEKREEKTGEEKIQERSKKNVRETALVPREETVRKEPTPMKDDLCALIDTSFRAIFEYSDFAKERKAIGLLASKARARAMTAGCEPRDVVDLMLRAFAYLRKTGDKFWRSQPFVPSALNSLWDRVVASMESEAEVIEPSEGARRFLEGKR